MGGKEEDKGRVSFDDQVLISSSHKQQQELKSSSTLEPRKLDKPEQSVVAWTTALGLKMVSLTENNNRRHKRAEDRLAT